MEQPHMAETVAARSAQISGKIAQERIAPKTIAFRDDLSMLATYAGCAHFQAHSTNFALSWRCPHR
jgi:hypothetical protein